MNISNFIEELKRRNVFKVATAYTIAGWIIIQVSDTVFPRLGLPDWTITFIIALVGIGFPIALIISWAFELTPDGIHKSNEVEITESVTASTGKKLNGIIIASLGVLVILLLSERIFFAESTIFDSDSVNIETASIAVLPFADMSEEGDQEYFSDGLSEELLNALAKVKNMKVAGRTSSFKFKGQNENLQIIGDELNVSHILEGSVRKAGNRIRITAQLIKVGDGFHVWSETYDREITATNIFDIQEEISRTVLDELKVRLLPEEDKQLASFPTQDIEAYNAYLAGTQLMAIRLPADLEKAANQFIRAIEIDPGFELAYAQLARTYGFLNQYGDLSAEESQNRMKEYIDKAQLAGGNEGRTYHAMGYYYSRTAEYDKSITAYERAIDLMPNDANAANGLAVTFQTLGRWEKYAELLRKAYELDPLDLPTSANYTQLLLDENELYEASKIADDILRRNPNFTPAYSTKATILAGEGKIDEAYIFLHQVSKKFPDNQNITTFLFDLSMKLDAGPLVLFYEKDTINRYPDSFLPVIFNVLSRTIRGEYKEAVEFAETNVFPRYGETMRRVVSPLSVGIAFNQGDYQKGISIIEKQFPELFSEPVTINDDNIERLFDYALLLNLIDESEKSMQFANLGCNYLEENTQQDGRIENQPNTVLNQFYCLVAQSKKQEATDLMERNYFEDNRKDDWIFDKNARLPLLIMKGYAPYDEFAQRANEDINRMKLNVYEYLKSEGEWREEWEVENSK